MAQGKKPRKNEIQTQAKVKTPMQVKEAVLDVFEKLGGSEGMLAWAQSSPEAMDKFYQIYAKMLPKHSTMEGSVTVDHSITRVLELIDGKTAGLPTLIETNEFREIEDGGQIRLGELEH